MFKKITYILLLCLCFAHGAERYELATHAVLLNKSREIIQTQVGLKEKYGDNSDEFVMEYLRSVGINFKAPYCAAGQYWGFDSARKWLKYNCGIDVENPLLKTAGATAQFNHFKKNGVKTAYAPHIDDLIVWQKSRSWTGHMERIWKIGKKGWVRTVGFNTSGSNPREGDGNYYKNRHLYNPLGLLLVKGLCGFRTKK